MDGGAAEEQEGAPGEAPRRRLWEELARCRRLFLEAQFRRLGLVTREEFEQLRRQLREQDKDKPPSGAAGRTKD